MRDVFSAIADPTRRQMLHHLAVADELSLHEMASRFPIGRTGVAKHLTVLREAGLVHGTRVGRETRYRLQADGLQAVEEWVSFYRRFWSRRIDRLKAFLEETET